MKRLFILFIFFSTTVFAQESKRTFNVSGFDKLDMGSAFVITVTQANDYKVDVAGREQDLKDLVVKVSGGTLDIGYPNNWGGWKNRKEVYVTITMPKLTGVSQARAKLKLQVLKAKHSTLMYRALLRLHLILMQQTFH